MDFIVASRAQINQVHQIFIADILIDKMMYIGIASVRSAFANPATIAIAFYYLSTNIAPLLRE